MSYIALFKNKNFGFLWLGQMVSEFGDRLVQMALIAGVYYRGEKGNIFRLAALLTFTIIPVFFVGPIAGVYTDKWNRKRTMCISDILRGIFVLFIPFFLLQTKNLVPVCIIVFIMFSITRFFLPAKLGIIPDIVPKKSLLLANSLITTTGLIAAVAGLGFGGIIVEFVGVKYSFYIDSLSFFASALAISLIRIPKPALKFRESLRMHSIRIREIEKNIFADIANSVRYIFGQKEIPVALKTFFVLMSGAGAIYVIFIDFILKNLTIPPEMAQQIQKIMGFGLFGFIIVLLGAGAFTGTILFGRFGHMIKRSKAISGGFMLTGFFLVLFSYSTQILKNFWVTGALAVLLGLSAAPMIIIANTLLHEVTRQEMRGKVFSTVEIIIHMAFLCFMFLSMFLATTLKIPPVHILGFTGGIAFLYGLTGWLKQKSL